MTGDEIFKHWMQNVQAVDLGDREIMDPARSGKSVGGIVRDAGGGLVFDTEPAQYYKLLRELAPDAGGK